MPNADGLLKPGMFAKVELKTSSSTSGAKVLAIPNSAVLDSGQRQHVFVRVAEGRFVAREVRLGMRGNDFVEVLGGVQEGEVIVVSGNFLIDSESNLKSALKGYGAAAQKVVSHHADGVLDSRDVEAGSVVVTHDPVASLNWPKMTMEFIPAHSGMFANIKPGTPMSFEFVERNPGEWVITKIDLKGKSNADRTH
jgi:Cu(I)/Ag(I) efflux system membrane fusion protein